MKSLSVLCYVVAGFLVYSVGIMAFMDASHFEPGAQIPVRAKYFVIGIFAVPALISLIGGLYVGGFTNVQRDIGIVLLSGACVAGLVALVMICIVMTPELKDQINTKSLLAFGDVTSGIGCNLLFALLGVILIWNSGGPGKPSDSSGYERSDDNPYSPPMYDEGA